MMNFYRIKQFYWSVSSKISNEDTEFIENNLNKNELSLFYMLSLQEQKHSVRVAYDVENVCKEECIDSKLLIKAALLHDIGKIYKKLNVIDKSIMVIADSITKGNIRRFDYIPKVNVYYNHGKIGCDILRRYNYDYKLLYLIENHHNDKIKESKELNILRICDGRN